MSALHPKADICPRDRDVCFGPIAELNVWLLLLLTFKTTGHITRSCQDRTPAKILFKLALGAWPKKALTPLACKISPTLRGYRRVHSTIISKAKRRSAQKSSRVTAPIRLGERF